MLHWHLELQNARFQPLHCKQCSMLFDGDFRGVCMLQTCWVCVTGIVSSRIDPLIGVF